MYCAQGSLILLGNINPDVDHTHNACFAIDKAAGGAFVPPNAASLPASGKVGELLYVNNVGYLWDGVAWQPLGGMQQLHEVAQGPLTANTTTSTTFQNAVTLTTSALPLGDYLLSVSYVWNHDSTGNDFEARIMQNAAQLGELHKHEPQDSAGGGPSGSTQRFTAHRSILLTAISGVQTIDLEFRTDTAGVESTVWEPTVEIKRIA